MKKYFVILFTIFFYLLYIFLIQKPLYRLQNKRVNITLFFLHNEQNTLDRGKLGRLVNPLIITIPFQWVVHMVGSGFAFSVEEKAKELLITRKIVIVWYIRWVNDNYHTILMKPRPNTPTQIWSAYPLQSQISHKILI